MSTQPHQPRALFFSKARGWWGTEHGGSHVKQAPQGPGSGGSAGTGAPVLPSSAGLSTLDEARAYWRAHLGGKTLPLTVHSGGKAYPIKVRFDADNTHAFTADIGGQQKTGKRGFDPDRAHALGRLLQVIDHPQRRLRDWDADLLLEQRIGGRHYTVVLKWEAGDTYRFSSAHFKTIEDVTRLFRRQNPRKNNGPLQKSEPSSAFPDASSPHGAGVIPFGVTSAALGSGQTSPHAEAAATFSIDHLNPLRKTAPMPMLLIFPNPAHHALVKAYIHGHYRLNAKTGQRHWVDSYTDKRPERGRASFTSTDHRVQHFDHHLTHGRQREALHVFHDLDHDESHKLALRLGLMHQTDPKGVDKKDLLESLHGAVRAKKAHTMKVGPYDKEEDAAFGREEKARKKADSAWITDRSPKQLVADGFIYSDTKQGYESAETAKRLVPIYRKRHPTADVVVTFDAQHQEATVWWAPKKPVSANANARLGHLAMDRVIADHDDVTQAMYREGPRWVSFYWGTAGNPKKGFAGGSGVAKIIAKRTAEGADGQAVARQMVEVIARGKVGEPYGPTGGERININHDGHTAVLSLVRFGKRESWLLTGWDDVASDGGKAVNASAAYAPDRSGMRDTAGAEPTSSVGQGIGEGKDAAPRPKPAEPAPAAREEIPDSAKQHFDSILGSAKRFGEGLDGARKTDAMFRGEGRYAAEAYSNMRETLESAYRSIGKQLDSIADPKRREIARQYFVDNMPNVDLTADEAEFFRDFKPVEKPGWMGAKSPQAPAPRALIGSTPADRAAIAAVPKGAPSDKAAPTEYRYALLNRPAGPGAIPRDGLLRAEPRPNQNEDHHAIARHGFAVYSRPLTDQEIKSYELAPVITGVDRDALVDQLAVAIEKYADGYAEKDKRYLRQAVMSRVEKMNGGNGAAVSNADSLPDDVLARALSKKAPILTTLASQTPTPKPARAPKPKPASASIPLKGYAASFFETDITDQLDGIDDADIDDGTRLLRDHYDSAAGRLRIPSDAKDQAAMASALTDHANMYDEMAEDKSSPPDDRRHARSIRDGLTRLAKLMTAKPASAPASAKDEAAAAKPKSPAPDIAQLLKDPQTTRTDLDRALLKLTNRMNAALRAGDHVKSDALEAMKQQVRDAVPAAEERSRARLAEEHRKLKAPLAKSLPHIFPASR